MRWQQSLIPDKDLLKVKAEFSVNAVLAVVFVDSNRTEVKRFIGYSEKNINEYSSFINQYLAKNKIDIFKNEDVVRCSKIAVIVCR